MVEGNLMSMVARERLGLGHRPREIYIKERWRSAQNLNSMDLVSHYGCVNAVEFDGKGDWLVSGGDDRRVLVWNVNKALAGRGYQQSMAAEHRSNIFCVGFDESTTRVYSGGNDEQVIVHNLETGQPMDYFLHEEPVYGLSVHPHQADIFTTACSDGRVLLFDMRLPPSTDSIMVAGYSHAFHAVQFNPVEPRLLVTANQKHGMGLWDVRRPGKCVLQYESTSSMHVRFNSAGTQIIGLRRRLPPILFNVESPVAVCEFDHPGYYNSCTMKSCCFGGPNDEFVLSGSDDFNLYMWQISDDETSWQDRAHLVLRGHRSIVNQVRYNPQRSILVSSGVEKIIKVWSALPLLRPSQGESVEECRNVYSHEGYIGLVLQSESAATQDVVAQSTSENPRMMAFFDSLVQRQIEGWDSEDTAETQSTRSESSEDSETGTSGFSHFSLSTRRLAMMEREAVSIADDLMREDGTVSGQQNTVEDELNSSHNSAENVLGSSNLDTTAESVEGAPSSGNRISQLIARKRAHLVARRRSKRRRTVDDAAVNKILTHAKKLVKLSSADDSSSSSSESCDAAKKLGRRRSSTPLISSPSSSSPSSSSSGDTLGPAGSHHRSAAGPSPSTAETPASPCLRIPTLSNGETPLIPDVDSAPLSEDGGTVGPPEAGQPPAGGDDKCYSSNHRHRKSPGNDDKETNAENLESLDDLLPGRSGSNKSKFILSLRRARSRILQGLDDSDTETQTQNCDTKL